MNMVRENKRFSLKKWNLSSRQKTSQSERKKRVKQREVPRRKTWSSEQSLFDE